MIDKLYAKLRAFITAFNRDDEECYVQQIPNANAEAFLREQIPLIEIPDPTLEEVYYFRWWTYRKHIRQIEQGHIITEFLPDVPWSGPYNSINCPSCLHIREGRWLKDPDGWIKEYILFWLDGIGQSAQYAAWYAHAVLEYCKLKHDLDFAVRCLPSLVRLFEAREAKFCRRCGLYWSQDGADGMEFSVGGSGFRPTVNSYAYGDAVAISEIARLAGNTEIQKRFHAKAERLRQAVDALLWDGDFYKTIPLCMDEDAPMDRREPIDRTHDARELCGYLPWYFNMPDDGKAVAFAQLKASDGFLAPCGLTTVEQRHPRFMEQHEHECLWNGPVWPFATSQTLVATANLLRNSTQDVFTKADYYALLLQYAKSHHRVKSGGSTVLWIDENLDPFTNTWIAREKLAQWGWQPQKGGYERGKDYNHSLFCDLILSGLLGIDVKDGAFVVQPLIPDWWDYFCVENLWLNGQRYRIAYDRDGTHYQKGTGLSVQVCPVKYAENTVQDR